MFFSVVIPLYNKEQFIGCTIKSILAQTFADFEIIVVNDGSTDAGSEIVAAIADSRIRLFNKENAGVSNARNYGIANASGRYIALLDADDRWDAKYLERMHEVILSHPEGRIFACCNAEVSKSGKLKINPVKNLLSDSISVLDYDSAFLNTLESPIHTSAVIFDKDLFDSYLFDEDIRIGQDLYLWLTMSRNHKVIMSDEVLSYYDRSDINAATARLAPLHVTLIPKLAEMLLSESDDVRRKLLTRLILNRIKRYYLFKNNALTREIISRCNFPDALWQQRLFFALPKWMMRLAYRFVKKLPDADSSDK